MYSGRKRLAPYLNGLTGLCFCVVPLDIVSGHVAHNLLDKRTLAWLLAAILAGRVHAAVAGPPCETRSRARERLLASLRGPRVMRSALLPWGLPCLRPKQLDQLFVANELLLTAIMVMSAMVANGACGFLEHPALPPNAESCSMWKLEVMRRLFLAPYCEHDWVLQGPLGQLSPKPTHLLNIRGP